MIAASTPYEGDSQNPLMEYAENISFDTVEEVKALQATRNPEDDLQIGGFERLAQFMSVTR